MYQYHQAYGKTAEQGAAWQDVNLELTSCNEIARQYRDVMFVLTHPSVSYHVTVHLEDIRQSLINKEYSFRDWLSMNGPGALPHHDGAPVLNRKYLRCGDAPAAGYQLMPALHTVHPDTELADHDKNDLLMTREDTDPVTIHDHALVTINGLIHRTVPSEHGLYIIDGMKSVRHAKRNNAGILNFQDMGEIQTFPITAPMIIRPSMRHKFKDLVYLKFPVPFEGKVPMVVLGGFLHVMNDALVKVSDDTVALKINRLPWVERYYFSQKLIDLKGLPMDIIDEDLKDSQRSYEELTGDTVILAMLQMSQSFLVLLDAKNVEVSYELLEHTGLPGRYMARKHPVGMVQGTCGSLPEYLVFPQHGIHVLALNHYRDNTLVIHKYRHEKTPVVVDYEPTGIPNGFVNARLINLSSVEVTYVP